MKKDTTQQTAAQKIQHLRENAEYEFDYNVTDGFNCFDAVTRTLEDAIEEVARFKKRYADAAKEERAIDQFGGKCEEHLNRMIANVVTKLQGNFRVDIANDRAIQIAKCRAILDTIEMIDTVVE